MKVKNELTTIEKSYAMARLEHLLNSSSAEDVSYLRQYVQKLAFINPEAKYLSEMWGMIELKYHKLHNSAGH